MSFTLWALLLPMLLLLSVGLRDLLSALPGLDELLLGSCRSLIITSTHI
jgi:hypothetical protein